MLVSLDFSEAVIQIGCCPSPASRPAPCENRLVFLENDKQAILCLSHKNRADAL